MKILLDECVPQDFCKSLVGHECHLARVVGFGGKKNGELLKLAQETAYQVLITVDQNIVYQQNLKNRRISLLILCTRSNKMDDLLPLVPACLEALRSIRPGQVLKISLHP